MSDGRLAADADDNAWRLRQDEKALAVIWPLLGRHIAFHRRLVDLTANVKAALLLSQTIYWTRHGRDIVRTAGWFLKTTEQWEMETGLSPKEQSTARAVLRDLSILHEQRLGVPAKLHFRLAVDQLGAMLSDRIGSAVSRLDWSDAAVVAELLGPSLAFHRTLAGIGGGIHAGLMLSRALHLTRLQWKRRLDAWVCNSEAQWSEEIGLTRREQETARRDLTSTGVWEETLTGIPPRLMARIRLDCLLSLLADGVPSRRPVIATPAAPDCGFSADRFSPKGDSSLRESHILESPKPPNQIRRIRRHSSDESANLHIEGSTSDSVQPLNAPNALAGDAAATSCGDLIFPEQLLPEERISAALLLRRCGDQAQALLDELGGRLQANSVRTSPVAYLRGLVNRANAGTFVPELGLRVAAARRRREEDFALRQQREAEERRLAAERATPEYQAKVVARRGEIRRLLDAMKSGRRTGKPS